MLEEWNRLKAWWEGRKPHRHNWKELKGVKATINWTDRDYRESKIIAKLYHCTSCGARKWEQVKYPYQSHWNLETFPDIYNAVLDWVNKIEPEKKSADILELVKDD